MLAKRIIPCLDIRDGRVVKGVSFEGLRDAGSPIELAERYNAEGADELVFLDITATNEQRETVLELAGQLAAVLFIPFTIGGGISTLQQIEALVLAGADKVSLNSAALRTPDLITQGARQFGAQCVVTAIDAKRREDGSYEVYSHAGTQPTGREVLDWAREAEDRGSGEILLTSIDCDGSKDGFEVELTRRVSTAVGIPVIASGGGGTLPHFAEVLREGKADAVLAASIFHFGTYNVGEVKEYLACNGVCVRR